MTKGVLNRASQRAQVLQRLLAAEGRNDDEGVAAEAHQRLALRAPAPQPLGHGGDDGIAERMAVGVVDELEAVQAQHHQCHMLLFAGRIAGGLLQQLGQALAVWQAREVVMRGLVVQGLLALGQHAAADDQDGHAGQQQEHHQRKADQRLAVFGIEDRRGLVEQCAAFGQVAGVHAQPVQLLVVEQQGQRRLAHIWDLRGCLALQYPPGHGGLQPAGFQPAVQVAAHGAAADRGVQVGIHGQRGALVHKGRHLLGLQRRLVRLRGDGAEHEDQRVPRLLLQALADARQIGRYPVLHLRAGRQQRQGGVDTVAQFGAGLVLRRDEHQVPCPRMQGQGGAQRARQVEAFQDARDLGPVADDLGRIAVDAAEHHGRAAEERILTGHEFEGVVVDRGDQVEALVRVFVPQIAGQALALLHARVALGVHPLGMEHRLGWPIAAPFVEAGQDAVFPAVPRMVGHQHQHLGACSLCARARLAGRRGGDQHAGRGTGRGADQATKPPGMQMDEGAGHGRVVGPRERCELLRHSVIRAWRPLQQHVGGRRVRSQAG